MLLADQIVAPAPTRQKNVLNGMRYNRLASLPAAADMNTI